MAFWDMISYIDILHWPDNLLNHDLVSELDPITVSDVIA